MNKFSLIALRLRQDKCSPSYRKVLKDEWYLFHKKYKIKEEQLVKNEGYLLPHDFFSEKINLHAIVGKNGSGKSSLIDLILLMLNNLSCRLLGFHSDKSNLIFVSGIHADLYYEIGEDCYRIECSGDDILLYKNDLPMKAKGQDLGIPTIPKESTLPLKIEKKDAFQILRTFFFTILSNYSLHSYNIAEYGKDSNNNEWLRGVFHKNDGYLVPISINPFRGNGKWDIIKETNLSNTRLALLFYQFKQEEIDFIDDYEYEKTLFKFNAKHIDEKYIVVDINPKTREKSKWVKKVSIHPTRADIFNYTLRCYFKKPLPDLPYIFDACRYLVAKTYQISAQYPNYKKNIKKEVRTFSNNCYEKGGERTKVEELVDKIKKDDSHVTIKIKQTITYIENIISHSEEDYNILDDSYLKKKNSFNSINDKSLSELDQLMTSFPPPFYSIDIRLKNKEGESINFEEMSSGERQFLFCMSSVLYHLKNIDSVKNDVESVQYKSVNIMLDEVELYFHPEYQRVFISKLIQYLKNCRFKSIEWYNILIVTHSPFILSDIPRDNIVFLDDGRQRGDTENLNTFGANIHDLLRHSFFLEKGLMGEFAKEKIKKIADILADEKLTSESIQKELQYLISMIGEPLIKDRLQNMYNEKYEEIHELYRELDRIQQKINSLSK